MQLAKETGEVDRKMSPLIHAALVESLFTNPGPLFAGALCAAIAAVIFRALNTHDKLPAKEEAVSETL